MQATDPTKYALIVTIIKPENLTYRNLLLLVQGFRNQMKGRFPDRIEFTPELMKRFRAHLGGEGRHHNKFLNIPCGVLAQPPESHILTPIELPNVHS